MVDLNLPESMMINLDSPEWIDLRQGCERQIATNQPFSIDPKLVLLLMRALEETRLSADRFYEEHRYCQWSEVD